MSIALDDLKACLDAVHAVGQGSGGRPPWPGATDLNHVSMCGACEEAIRPLLGDLYRMVRALDGPPAAWGAPSPSPPAPGSPLTEREREVLRWLGGGKTDKDIGDILGISPRTVHKHLQRIYEKLGVETRTAAVVRAMKLRSPA
jgi:DNA-binding CsgD family transcriptional regulator